MRPLFLLTSLSLLNCSKPSVEQPDAQQPRIFDGQMFTSDHAPEFFTKDSRNRVRLCSSTGEFRKIIRDGLFQVYKVRFEGNPVDAALIEDLPAACELNVLRFIQIEKVEQR